MSRFTFTLDDKQQAIAEEMASHSNQSVKECLSRILDSRISHFATRMADQKWADATPEQKKSALTALSKGAKKDGNKKQKATKKKAG
jgi:uncharacterized protein YbcC (UPF0753/DUF2309 family)